MAFEKFRHRDKYHLKNYLPILLLVIATVAVYGVTARFELLNTLDDKFYLILNDTVKSITFVSIKHAFSGYFVGNYAPIHIISYMVDYSLWKLNPAGYHLENVLLHLFNGLLFYLLLRRLSMSQWQAAAAAWIFLFHPVQVETVAWVSQRKNLLAMFFFLLAFLGYQAYLERKSHKTILYIFSVISIVAAMLSKSIAVIFPAVLILYDVTYRRETNRSKIMMVADKLPYIIAAVAVGLLAIISQAHEAGGGRRDFPGGSPMATFFTMVPVLVSYIRDCFLPFEISPYYMVAIRQQPDAVFVSSLTIFILLSCIAVFLYFKYRPMLFWFGLFFIALLPVLQFVPLITLKNDRYLYFSLLGFSVLMVSCVMELQLHLSPRGKNAVLAGSLLVLLVIPLLAYKQTLYWQNDVSIWSRAIDLDPENRLAWLQITKGYTDKGDAGNAMRSLKYYNELRIKYGPVRGFEGQ
jgi:hypothetical protein